MTKPGETQKNWTDGMHARLREMLAKGATMREIAAHLGLTRNAVAGKAHRLGLTALSARMRKKPKPIPPRKVQPPKPAPTPKAARPPRATKTIPPSVPEPKEVQRYAPPPEGGFTFMQQRDGLCRWPISKSVTFDDFRCCGAKTDVGHVYCEAHAQMAAAGPARKIPTPTSPRRINSIMLISKRIR